MGAGASVPATREEALAQGYTEEQIRKYMSQMGEEKNQQEYENRPDHLKAFLTACSEGDLETVRTLVENENVDIETKSMSGAPGVFFAAQGGFVPVLEYLNDRDANFKASDFGGSTPFHEASRKGHPDAIEFMCSMAAGRVDIHKTDGQVRPMRYALVRVIHVQPTRLGRIGANILQSTSLDRLSVWVNRDGMR